MPVTDVLDSTMYYEDRGEGVPFVFLHGNPASSHLWRGVLPRIEGGVRVLAPDLIGMGRSGKPGGEYRFADHARYLDAWFEALGLDEVVLVGQDWGGALAFDWAARHPGRVRGLAFMETIVRPLSWAEYPPALPRPVRGDTYPGGGGGDGPGPEHLHRGQHQADGAEPDERGGPRRLRRALPDPREPASPMLRWACSLPIDGQPADVLAVVEAYDAWLAASPEVPKLLLTFDGSPALMIKAEQAAWCAENVSALETEYCGPAAHLAPEDRPEEIAAAVSSWARRHDLLG